MIQITLKKKKKKQTFVREDDDDDVKEETNKYERKTYMFFEQGIYRKKIRVTKLRIHMRRKILGKGMFLRP